MRAAILRLTFITLTIGAESTTIAQEEPDRLIDLTHSFDESTIYWPTEEGFKLIPAAAGITELGYFYAANRFIAAEHGGTHLDAPRRSD